MFSIAIKEEETGITSYLRTEAGAIRSFSSQKRALSFVESSIHPSKHALVDIVDKPKFRPGRKLQPIVTKEDAPYILTYIEKRFGVLDWAQDLVDLSHKDLDEVIYENLSRKDIQKLRASIRKNRQSNRESSLRFPPRSLKVSGDALAVIEKFISRSDYEDSASDIIMKFLEPIANLSTSERDNLYNQINNHAGFW